jgi:hypothetical protein
MRYVTSMTPRKANPAAGFPAAVRAIATTMLIHKRTVQIQHQILKHKGSLLAIKNLLGKKCNIGFK